MAAACVALWVVCVLRVTLATIYFQEEFLDGGEVATPLVAGAKLPHTPLPNAWPELPSDPGLTPRDWWWQNREAWRAPSLSLRPR